MSSADQANILWGLVIIVLLLVHLMWRSRRFDRVSLCEIAFWMCSLFFGVGPIVAFANSEYGLPQFPVRVVSAAYLSVLMFLGTLLFIHAVTRVREREFDESRVCWRATSGRLARLQESILAVPSAHIFALLGAFICLQLVLLLKYNLGTYASAKLEVLQALPYQVVVLYSLSMSVLRPALEFWAFSCLWRRSRLPLAVVTLAASFAFIMLSTSRSQLIAFAVLAGLTYLISRRAAGLKPVLVGLATFLLVFFVLLPELWLLRTAWTSTGAMPTGERISQAWSLYHDGLDRESAARRQSDNLARRPYIIGFNLMILSAQEGSSLMWGRVAGSSLLSVVPSVVYSAVGQQKIFYSSEAYAMTYYTGSGGDTSSNWPGTYAADFGVMGGLVAGLVLGLLLSGAEYIALLLSRRHIVYGLIILGAFLPVAINVEVLIENAWIAVRDSLFAMVLAAPLVSLFGQKTPTSA